ncbi:flagellar protein export ATPase FliI [Laribacter hongkongensis]|uniref:Flagellum-specific ATP synthase n=1 Tax=Laribacter hongkongensis TaxID=168471 RepID=A0ABD4SR06_9NEIS|nr:flagellar protein export ATPase FliI [Laribacter hongkongensis]MCG9025646.1 flagellar protein export ATPase FliI [Laribacter hongkongensis]MCG9100087.1 flagellar protein export ATPase FliI [Laribacter hongkongensis]MCG9102620.1 flagellar protein export ATPase FliI [Laribacter hongkongensis]MCG9112933.1 flagellar protein export ATPase FliI [Laribacter hongkongensis]MCG9118120.1 flagellar protein export ATPase FliI [Laribacter hongkongensis]
MAAPCNPWHDYLAACCSTAGQAVLDRPRGYLTRVTGLVMEAVGLRLPVGGGAWVTLPDGRRIEAEVVGFNGDVLYLMPVSSVQGLLPGAAVEPDWPVSPPVFGHAATLDAAQGGRRVPVGMKLLGRIVDSLGRPLDEAGPVHPDTFYPLHAAPINPLDRDPVRSSMDVGVRAINGLLTVGRGQRLGLFAGSGVGKSVLLGMMAKYTRADVVVVGLIGERGREVKDFIENILGEEGLARAVVVAAPADTPPLMRLHGAAYATALAEYYRDQGLDVLLLMDSVTRYAMAQREIALAIGEPPVTRGYPPSVFAKLPQLIERAGNGRAGGGSITAFYTVLSEGDDQQDPVADSSRAILDGHFVLNRRLAEAGHYPAIDIEQSISRVMVDVVSADHVASARRFKQFYSRYQRNLDLISVGAYVSGADPMLDEAIRRHDMMESFLIQPAHEASFFAESVTALNATLSGA